MEGTEEQKPAKSRQPTCSGEDNAARMPAPFRRKKTLHPREGVNRCTSAAQRQQTAHCTAFGARDAWVSRLGLPDGLAARSFLGI